MENKNQKSLASVWQRILAAVLEMGIWITPSMIFVYYVSLAGDLTSLLNGLLALIIFNTTLNFFVSILNIYLMAKFGGTLGKILSGIEVAREDGKYLSFFMAFFRNYVGYTVSGLMFFLGFFWALIDEKKQGWHDMMAESYVYRKKPLTTLSVFLLFILIFINAYLGVRTVGNIKSNSSMFSEIFDDIKTEMERADPSNEINMPEEFPGNEMPSFNTTSV